MTPAETLKLVRMAKAMCPAQKFDEYTPDAWHLLLSDLDAHDALAALTSLAKKQPFVSPAEIRTEAKAARTANARAIERNTPVKEWIEMPHGFDPDDTGAYARLLAERRAMAARGIQPPTYQLANPAPRPPGLRALPMKEIPSE